MCRAKDITRIGCWDHARRKFVEASKAAQGKDKKGKVVSRADVALGHINKLYAIERQIKGLSDAERYRIRQAKSLPQLKTLKTWLEANVRKVMKGSLTRKAMEYTLNQWDYLVGYCERGDLQISNVLAENAIRPFAVGRRAWLFSDTSRGARASATCYSLIETARLTAWNPRRISSLCWSALHTHRRWRRLNSYCREMRSWSRLQKRWLSSAEGKGVDLVALTFYRADS